VGLSVFGSLGGTGVEAAFENGDKKEKQVKETPAKEKGFIDVAVISPPSLSCSKFLNSSLRSLLKREDIKGAKLTITISPGRREVQLVIDEVPVADDATLVNADVDIVLLSWAEHPPAEIGEQLHGVNDVACRWVFVGLDPDKKKAEGISSVEMIADSDNAELSEASLRTGIGLHEGFDSLAGKRERAVFIDKRTKRRH
jgi:hypothetical protein